MAVSLVQLRSWARQYRSHAECTAVALLALSVALILGLAARHQMVPERTALARLKATDAEVSSFRALFRSSAAGGVDATDDVLQLPDSEAITVPRELRVSLAQKIVGRAEALGLTDVRIRFSTTDTAASPKPPDLASARVRVADYTVALDCAGGFGAVLSLVEQLPPSVALERLTAIRTRAGGRYHLSLAVFEAASTGSPTASIEVGSSSEHG